MGEWVECDKEDCKQWWHAECAQVNEQRWKKIKKNIETFVCPHCVPVTSSSCHVAPVAHDETAASQSPPSYAAAPTSDLFLHNNLEEEDEPANSAPHKKHLVFTDED